MVLDKRRTDHIPHFDLTINIPTIIILVGLLITGLVKANDFINGWNKIRAEHEMMWKDYLEKHGK